MPLKLDFGVREHVERVRRRYLAQPERNRIAVLTLVGLLVSGVAIGAGIIAWRIAHGGDNVEPALFRIDLNARGCFLIDPQGQKYLVDSGVDTVGLKVGWQLTRECFIVPRALGGAPQKAAQD